jgi:hypothetical protein
VSQCISKTFSATLEADPFCSTMKLLTSIRSFLQLYPLVCKDYPDRLYYAASPAVLTFNSGFVVGGHYVRGLSKHY